MQIMELRNRFNFQGARFDAMDVSGQCTVTATLRRFSSCAAEQFVSMKYECDDDRFDDYFQATFWANGSCPEREGHVSIIFSRNYCKCTFFPYEPTKFSCTASVMDASGNKRFLRSFVRYADILLNRNTCVFCREFGFQKYLRRSTLLSESSELLPDDTLTLCLEIYYEASRPSKYDSGDLFEDRGQFYFSPKSKFARELYRMSSVFQQLVDSEMAGKEGELALLEPEEYNYLKLILDFLSGRETLQAKLSDFVYLYITADMCDMQPLVELCHQLYISLVRAAMESQEWTEHVEKGMRADSELVETSDERLECLRSILRIHSDIKNNTFDEGDSDGRLAADLKTEWSCEFRHHELGPFVLFKKVKREDPRMHFYE